MDPETLYGVFDAVPGEPSEPGVAEPGTGPYGGDMPRPRYNIAPTTDNLVVRVRPAGEDDQPPVRRIDLLRWGLVPSWAKDPSVGNRLFNARAESVGEKPAFRRALARRRCLVPASGWYEWQKLAQGEATGGRGPAKQAFYLTPEDGSVLAFAGLWEYWRPAGADRGGDGDRGGDADPDGGDRDGTPADRTPIVSYTILTTASVGALQGIHPRMPLVLPASEWDAWLDPSREDVAELLEPPDEDLVAQLELRPIGTRVGNVRFDDPSLQQQVTPAPGAVGSDRTADGDLMLPLALP
ncbi:DUF159 family protein [Nakamurella endophytica]|uniref:Abasic site processing protein n=2 Tax=Nakamurella endophytica TaxID=1748367 RepID=A0A917WB21_9ACTN|nr:DUF159 family protein [Nakamurella endophytica]